VTTQRIEGGGSQDKVKVSGNINTWGWNRIAKLIEGASQDKVKMSGNINTWNGNRSTNPHQW